MSFAKLSIFFFTLCILSSLIPKLSNAKATPPRHPFGSHLSHYTAGTILPNHVSQKVLDASVRAYYDHWKAKYLANGCGEDRYYINFKGKKEGDGGTDPDSISISEGHGYGMIIFAFMAGHDRQAKTYFDGMYYFYKDHPSSASRDLMAWNQVKSCKNSRRTGGAGTATDGDLDIAFALLLADQQWGSSGYINYRHEAQKMLVAIKRVEIEPQSGRVLLGDFATPEVPNYYNGTRPSDFMPDHFKSFESASGDASWTRVVNGLYTILDQIQKKFSLSTGLIPDFIIEANTNPSPALPNYLESSDDGEYAYNSCRVPWRIATDYLLSGDFRAQKVVQKINVWIKKESAGDPSNIVDGYTLAGVKSADSRGPSLPFLGTFMVGAMVDQANQTWLNTLWDKTLKTAIREEDYYGNTLKMLTLITASGNYWIP